MVRTLNPPPANRMRPARQRKNKIVRARRGKGSLAIGVVGAIAGARGGKRAAKRKKSKAKNRTPN